MRLSAKRPQSGEASGHPAVDAGPLAAVEFMRTDAERRDQALAWARPDERFFASGACHVLAFRFVARRSRYRAVLVRPVGAMPGAHVFATDGVWAFDFNGWSPVSHLVAANKLACERRWPGWTCELVDVTDVGLATFCATGQHRSPADFAGDVVARADRFIDRSLTVPPSGEIDQRSVSTRPV